MIHNFSVKNLVDKFAQQTFYIENILIFTSKIGEDLINFVRYFPNL